MRQRRYLLLIAIITLVFVGCQPQKEVNTTYCAENQSENDLHAITSEVKGNKNSVLEEETSKNQETVKQTFKEVEIEEDPIRQLNIGAVGDIMVHTYQLRRAYDETTENYDFKPAFEMVKNLLEKPDVMVGNLETTTAGKNKGVRQSNSAHFKGFLGFPRFNTPVALLDGLKYAGFDLLGTANNHSLDSGESGVMTTIEALDQREIKHFGTRKDDNSHNYLLKTYNDISLCFMAYTYGTNGIPIPEGKDYLVNSFNMYDDEAISNMYKEIEEVKSKTDCDLMIVAIHYGNEYHNFPNIHQKKINSGLFEAGANLILGSHPHVLQPIEVVDIERNGEKEQGVVINSLGNFISSQRYLLSDPVPKDAGVITNFIIEKDTNTNKTKIVEVKVLPTWVQWSDDFIRVIPVDESIEDYEKNENQVYNLEENDYKRLKNIQKYSKNHLLKGFEGEFQKKDAYYSITLGK